MQISLLNNIINSLEIYEETDSELFKKYTKENIDKILKACKDSIE